MDNIFDKQGKPIGVTDWAKLVEDREYKIIKQETLPNGNWVSTVWLGLDHSFGGEKPLIFETMVFSKKGNFLEKDMARYSTLEEAQKGHEEMVKKYSSFTVRAEVNWKALKQSMKPWWKNLLRKLIK